MPTCDFDYANCHGTFFTSWFICFVPYIPVSLWSPPILVIVARLLRIDMDNEIFCSHIYKTNAQTCYQVRVSLAFDNIAMPYPFLPYYISLLVKPLPSMNHAIYM